MDAIILCRFRSDQAIVAAALMRRIGFLALKEQVRILFSASWSEPNRTEVLAVAINTVAEAEALVEAWRIEDAGLKDVEIQCLHRNRDLLEDLRQTVFV